MAAPASVGAAEKGPGARGGDGRRPLVAVDANGAAQGGAAAREGTSCAAARALAESALVALRAADAAHARGEPCERTLQLLLADIAGLVGADAARRLDVREGARFYSPVAERVASDPALVDELLPLVARLRTQAWAAPALALLLHQWMWAPRSPRRGAAVPQPVVVLVHRGMRELFYMDLETDAERFKEVHRVAWESLGSRSGALASAAPAQRREALATLAAFALYYGADPCSERLAAAVGAMPDEHGWCSDSDADTATLVAEAASLLLETVNITPALLRVLRAVREHMPPHISRVEDATRLRLERVLYKLATPGGNRMPCEAVQTSAREALDALCPVGRRGRWAVSGALNVLARPTHATGVVAKHLFRTVAWALTWPMAAVQGQHARASDSSTSSGGSV